MTIPGRRGNHCIDAVDPTASSLRHHLRADSLGILASDRHTEIGQIARERRLLAAISLMTVPPPRRSRGLRHALAGALVALARQLEADCLEPAGDR